MAIKQILVVDDDHIVRTLLGVCFERAGYKVRLAQDGTEAVREILAEDVDLVIVDLMMPMMDGLRFVQWFRGEAKRTTPVYVLTAAVDKKVEREVLEAGANRVLYKPMGADEILRAVKELDL